MLAVGQIIPGFCRLSEEYRGAMGNCILRGYSTIRADVAYLVTSGAPQKRPLAQVRRELGYGFAGNRVPGCVDEIETPHWGAVQFLAEEVPRGEQLDYADRPLPPTMVARMLRQVADLIAHAHDRGVTLFGVRPELVWADGWAIDRSKHDLQITGMTPRTMRFLHGMEGMRGGLCLDDAYSPAEVWRGEVTGPAVDVFGLCALGYYLLTNRAPFPANGDFNEAIRSVLVGEQPDWSGVAFADVLAPGLARDPSARPMLGAVRAGLV